MTTRRPGSFSKGTSLLLLTFSLLACSTTTTGTRQDITGSDPDLKFKAVLWADREDNTYELGEEISFFFAANQTCYLTLLHVGRDGTVAALLPNKYQRDTLALAGYVYQIPSQSAEFTFKAREPAGEETLKAIATLDEISLYDRKVLKATSSSPESIESAEVVAEDIDAALSRVDTGSWTTSETTIRIVEKRL